MKINCLVTNAFQLPAEGDELIAPFHNWCEEVGFNDWESDRFGAIIIPDPDNDGVIGVEPLDWILKRQDGTFTACDPETFSKLFEKQRQQTHFTLMSGDRDARPVFPGDQ